MPLTLFILIDYPLCVNEYEMIDFVFKEVVGHNFNKNDAFMSLFF